MSRFDLRWLRLDIDRRCPGRTLRLLGQLCLGVIPMSEALYAELGPAEIRAIHGNYWRQSLAKAVGARKAIAKRRRAAKAGR